jgi:hypothetical protein
MANVTIPNYTLSANTETTNGVWKLTLALIKAGWLYRASGNGTSKDTSAAITSCLWGAPAAVGGQTGNSFSITTKTGDDLLLTGLTGLVSPTPSNQGGSEGRFLTIAGAASGGNNGTFQIVNVVSATSCWIRNASGVAGDANNGTVGLTWAEKDPITGVSYPSFGNGSWILLRGPSVLKIPITVAASGSFFRGETITQATTGAEGELVGITWDGTSTGYLVVMPRVTGSGASRRGWHQDGTSTYVITGSTSGATVNPNGTIVEYVQETVFSQNSNSDRYRAGNIFHQCVDIVGESTSLFSTLAGSAGCTAAVCPGGGGTSNTFPSVGTWAPSGTGGTTLGQYWHRTNYTAAGPFGNAQIMVANAIERTGQSADGSFMWSVGCTGSGNGARANGGFFFMRCDDSEEGDVNPFAWCTLTSSVSIGTRSRTTEVGVIDNDISWRMGNLSNGARGAFTGWRKRGLSGDGFVDMLAATLAWGHGSGLASLLNSTPTTDPEKVANAVNTVAVTEPVWVVTEVANMKIRKGTLRWCRSLCGSTAFDTYDSKKWVTLDTTGTTLYDQAVCFGPWDQSTAPVQ